VRFVGEVQPARGAVVLIGGWGIRIRARTARWVAGCTAAGSVALIGAGLALTYVDRHLVPASLTNWTVSGVSGQVVNMAVPLFPSSGPVGLTAVLLWVTTVLTSAALAVGVGGAGGQVRQVLG
jgi:hypothetical protein